VIEGVVEHGDEAGIPLRGRLLERIARDHPELAELRVVDDLGNR
jgi:hypothetical protein